jgi:hypothetical protein
MWKEREKKKEREEIRRRNKNQQKGCVYLVAVVGLNLI